LVQVAANGTWTNEIDVAAYEATANPDGGELDSNPYAIERVDGGYLVADAGANALLHVADDGTITTAAVFPNRMVEFPSGSGEMMPMQAVPTSVDVGPDGAYYVGQLTGFPFPVDGANIYRVVEGEEPEVYAEGFTNIVDLAFAEDGTLYVVEITSNSLLSGDPHGALIRLEDDGSQTVIADDLFMPGGVAIGQDGYLYVTTRAALGDGMGEVLRINAQFTAYLPVIVPPGTAETTP
jgi:glucose/arabinose dehydrogenase